MGELSEEEEEELKRRVELLMYAGLNTVNIIRITGRSRHLINRLKKEIILARQNTIKEPTDIATTAINEHKRILEEAWNNYIRSEDKDKALNTLIKIRQATTDELIRLGHIKAQPTRLDVTTNGKEIEMTQLFALLEKIDNEGIPKPRNGTRVEKSKE